MADGGDPELFVHLGMNVKNMVAGFAGGVVVAFAMKQSEPLAVIGSMVVGALTANYLSDPFSHYLGTGQGTTGFLVGVGGMAIVQGIISAARTWTPFNGKGGGKDA